MQTLKVAKVRARKIAEPKIKIKYPKKFSIKTEDSSITVLKNDLPWTLHPLPPPLSTATTVKLEADKSMPWALHPLPPPVKTKNYSDYYWPDSKTRPKYVYVTKPLIIKPYKFAKAYKQHKFAATAPDFRPSDFKHSGFTLSDYKPVDYKPPASDNYKHGNYDRPAADYKHANNVKHVNYKHIDYKHVDYKSPDYKPEFSQHADDDADLDERLEDDGQHPVYDHHSYSHDDHSAAADVHDGGGDDDNDDDGYKSSPSRQPQSSEYVSHISIEPSIQVATFSETDTRGAGTSQQAVSQGVKTTCRCPATGHRHKRHAPDNDTAVAAAIKTDSVAEPSAVMRGNSFAASRWNTGHATDVVIQKSHDITDNLMPTITANASERRPIGSGGDTRWPKKMGTTFRHDSDMFKVDFGHNTGARDEHESRERYLLDDDTAAGGGGDFGNRQVRKPDRPRGYHVTKSMVENNGGEVSFSVQTPFSVSSFSSNVRQQPYAEEHDDYRSGFQFTEPKTTSSSSSAEYLKPLDFEQFGFKSALQTDDKLSGRPRTGHFSRNGFSDRPSSVFGGDRFSENFDDETSDFSSSSGGSRLGTPFSRDFGDDRSKPFRYNTKNRGSGLLSSSNRFNAGGPSPSSSLTQSGATSDGSVLEYFRPVVVDVFGKSDDNKSRFKIPAAFGNHNGGNNYGDRSRYFGKTANPTGFSKFRHNQNPNPLRLPGGLHESTENLSRKMVFHPSTFDVDQ